MGKMYVKIENKVRYVQWEKNISLMEVTFDLMKASIFATTVLFTDKWLLQFLQITPSFTPTEKCSYCNK